MDSAQQQCVMGSAPLGMSEGDAGEGLLYIVLLI
jgi:hypothetical protein